MEQITPSGRWVQESDGSWTLTREVVPEHPTSRRPEDYEPVLVDWFGPEAQGSPWVQIAGTAASGWVYEPTAPTVAGVYRFTCAAGQTGVLEWQGTTPLPFGLDDTYRVRVRVKAPDTFDGQISVGMIGYAFDGTTLVDELGGTVPTLGHAAIRKITGLSDAALAGYSLFEGYVSGRSPLAGDFNIPADGTSAPWDVALKLAPAVYYWRPYIQVTGGTSTASVDIDAMEVFRLDSNVVVPGSVQTDLIDASSANFGTLTTDALILTPVPGDDPTGWVLTSDGSGGGTWQRSANGIVFSDTEPVVKTQGMGWYDTSVPDVEEFWVHVQNTNTTARTVTATGSTFVQESGWSTWTIEVPCDGLLICDFHAFLKAGSASGTLSYTIRAKTASGCTVTERSNNNGQIRVTADGTISTAEFRMTGKQVFDVASVASGGGVVEFAHYTAMSGTAGTIRLTDALFHFIPFGAGRYQKITVSEA